MSLATIFPGQGSQFVGMARELAEENPRVRERFDEADSILGYSLSDIMFSGPEEKLTQTSYTQPAIFLHSVALHETLELTPDMTGGHSLGEFSAIVAAGAVSFSTGLELVALRGSLMQQAGEVDPGTMAAIIGMEDGQVEKLCSEASELTGKPVVLANYNSPGQLVISGDLDAVEKAVEMAREQGCRLAKVLQVSGAFHSPLMKTAYEGLKEKLESVEFNKPDVPVYSNVTAEPAVDPVVLRENLLKQLLEPVRWTESLQNMKKDGANRFIEVGPGKVLQGLVKRTLKDVEFTGYQ
ncbi:MAG: ACP S-malonyltransferase [Balneolaceae bacterium]